MTDSARAIVRALAAGPEPLVIAGPTMPGFAPLFRCALCWRYVHDGHAPACPWRCACELMPEAVPARRRRRARRIARGTVRA
jgi:hypothetical protein